MADLSLDALQVQIQNLSEHTETQTTKLAEHLIASDEQISQLKAKNIVIQSELDDCHQEHHTLENQVNQNKWDIEQLQLGLNTNIDNDNALSKRVTDLHQQHDDEIADIHDEIHMLGNSLDNEHTRLLKLETYTLNLPPHIVLPEEDYNKIETKDPSCFYFVYDPADDFENYAPEQN